MSSPVGALLEANGDWVGMDFDLDPSHERRLSRERDREGWVELRPEADETAAIEADPEFVALILARRGNSSNVIPLDDFLNHLDS